LLLYKNINTLTAMVTGACLLNETPMVIYDRYYYIF